MKGRFGGRFAQTLAGLAAALAPIDLHLRRLHALREQPSDLDRARPSQATP